MWSITEDTPPQEIIDFISSDVEFDRAGRIRIYKLCALIEGLLDGTIKRQ
jgi:hypothetical protein